MIMAAAVTMVAVLRAVAARVGPAVAVMTEEAEMGGVAAVRAVAEVAREWAKGAAVRAAAARVREAAVQVAEKASAVRVGVVRVVG